MLKKLKKLNRTHKLEKLEKMLEVTLIQQRNSKYPLAYKELVTKITILIFQIQGELNEL